MPAEYRLKARERRRILNWRGENVLVCFRCEKEILVGDWIHRNDGGCMKKLDKLGGKRSEYARFYHKSCFAELYVDV